MSKTKIEWTENTWNPLTGCSKISPGCANCYAERMARRLQAMGAHNYRNGFRLTLHEHTLDTPLRWKKPRMVFVNSMSDLFHRDAPLDFIRRVFDVMARAPQHTFQVLTKRSTRLAELAGELPWPDNVWMGVSIENADYAYRLDNLAAAPAAVRFLSLEPLLGPVGRLRLGAVDWVIVGGESGPGARPMREEWVTEVRDQCERTATPFFFKQWGGVNKKKTGRRLQGRVWDQRPAPAPGP
jgi:protein gp37